MTLQQLLDTWNQFFHAQSSCATLVLFRILSGCLLLLNALLLVPLINDFFSEDGVWPTSVWSRHVRGTRLCVLNLLPPTTRAFRFLLLVHMLSVVCYLIGFQYRIATVTLFVTMTSIHHRNAYILSSGDTLLRILVFLMCFSDGAGGLSVDSWLAEKPFLAFQQTDPWPMRIMQIQVCIIYLRTVFWKLRGNMWWAGTAAWYPLWVEAYVRFRPPSWMLNTAAPPTVKVESRSLRKLGK